MSRLQVEWVMPTASETLKAEDAHLSVDWVELGITVRWLADAIIETLVKLGPRYCATCEPGECCGSMYDPCEDEGVTAEADTYCRLARAIGVLE